MSLPVTMPKNTTNIASSILNIEHEFSFFAVAMLRDELFATPWFSNAAFERRDVYFRVLVAKEMCKDYNTSDYYRSVRLQVCSCEQRDAIIKRETEKGEVCRFDVASSASHPTLALRMAFGKVSFMFSLNPSVENSSAFGLLEKRLQTPSEHLLGSWPRVERQPDKVVSITFKAEVFETSIPPVAEAGAEEIVSAATSTGSALSLLGRLLGSGVLSDVTLLVGGEELRAHRCVLAAASPVFRRMFEHTSYKESLQGLVDVQGVRPEVMAAALRFLYGQEPGAALELDTLCDLLVLAERYELLELKQNCDQRLAGDRQADPLQLLTLAVMNNAPLLREAAVKRIAGSKDRESIINSSTVQEVMKSHPDVALELMLKL